MAERPFQTQLIRLGAGGLNLRAKADVVPPHQLTKHTNGVRLRSGSITSRPGQTEIASAAGRQTIHSITRMNDVLAGTFQRVWGVDTFLYYGATGVLTLAEAGFSGDPFTMVVADPPIPGLPWTYIADRTKMRKIRSDGLDMEIGLPAGVLISAVPSGAVALKASIEPFDAIVGWQSWIQNVENPTVFSLIAGPVAGNALEQTTDPGAEPAGYNILSDKPIGPLNLTVYPASGGVPITDTDFLHLWVRTSFPDIDTVLIYLTSGPFTPGVRPGMGGPGVNDSYFLALFQLGTNAWTEFGTLAVPPGRQTFRNAFVAHGPAPDWSNITGISVFTQVNSNVIATLDLDDMYIYPRLAPGSLGVPYDYRVTDYDPRTGVEGNPSPVQPASQWISTPLSVVILTPQAYGDAAMRQRFYRRGNTLPDNWYLLGTNTVDGGVFFDTLADGAIAAAPTVEIDHDQPVTSLDATGATILNQPVPVLFGPVNGQYFACGDPHRPSTLYASQPDRPDYWPATYAQAVSGPGETLQNGCVWGAEGYVASNQRWFRLIPNLQDAAIITAQPTGATKGLLARWAMVVGPDGVHYLSDDGWYRHTGGPQENLTDAELYPLFHGQAVNGYFPVDFSRKTLLRMGTRLNEVWFQYADTQGTLCHMVRDVLSGEFRIVIFGAPTAVAVGEIEDPQNPPSLLLLGSLAGATAYTHTGTSDAGAAIPVTGRTAALDQGFPRQQKQYGDVVVKGQLLGVPVTITPYLDDDAVPLAGVVVTSDGVQSIDPFGGVPTEGVNVALEFSWSTPNAPPVLDFLGPSYFIQPDTTVARISDWDDIGAQGETYLKGCVIDCDTAGQNKTVVVEATLYDGTVTTIATLSVNANGRRKLTFTWARQAVSLVRLRPTDAHSWTRWNWQWIADEEPLALVRWETEPLDFAIPGWKTILELLLTLRTTAAVTLTVTAFYDNGGSVVQSQVIPSTGGVKQSPRLTFEAGKGVLYSFVFTSNDGSRWRLYREETTLVVKPLAGDTMIRHPFGNDDLDLVRGMQSAQGTASTPGGGEG